MGTDKIRWMGGLGGGRTVQYAAYETDKNYPEIEFKVDL
jgi:hypothetical protein